MNDETSALLDRLSRGDATALEPLLQRHLPGLRGYVRLRSGRLLREKEGSSDIVQSVCRDVLQHIDRFQYPSEAGFRRWLYTTALRKIQQRYEHYLADKRDAGREVAADARSGDTGQGLLDCYASFATPSRELVAREEVDRIESAFDRLPEDDREVILLARVLGLSRAEIAQRMGLGVGAVRTRLSRALARLADLLDG